MSNLEGRGYAGKILYTDLDQGRFRIKPLKEDVAFRFIGGKGLGAYILFREMATGTSPLSPESVLVVSTGPLTGTIAPGGNRFCVIGKSPATGTFNDSHCGGRFGITLKRAGFDALVLKGACECEELSILVIDEDDIWTEPATWAEGATTVETEEELRRRLGENFEFLVIGPAGERMSLVAGVFSNHRAAGRGGLGAVMGSKKLKAVAAKGDKPIRVYDPERFKRFAWIAHRIVRMHEATARDLPRYGSANILDTINEMGALPTKNYKTGFFEDADAVTGKAWRDEVWVRDVSCEACPIACGKVAVVENGAFKDTLTDGPEYESIWALGPQCGVSDKAAIAYSNQLCDLYGVDTISVGGIIAFVMECFEKGVLTSKELDGLSPVWGDGRAMVSLVEKICRMEGIGKTLCMGVKRIADWILGEKGVDCSSYAMHVKGLELPAYEPRAAQGMGLGYATSDRGGCHLRGWTAGQELLGYGGAVDPLTTRGKAQLVIDRQNEKAVVDSVGICFYPFQALTLKEIKEYACAMHRA